LELARVLGVGPGVEVEALVPAAAVEDPLLRVAAEELLGDDGLAPLVRAFDDAHLFEQGDERAVLPERRGQVVRAPRVRHDAVSLAAARRPARRRFEFEQHEVVEPLLQQTPRRRQPRHAPAHDDDARALPTVRRDFDLHAVAQQVPEPVRRADDLALRQPRDLFARTARREREGRAEEGGEDFTTSRHKAAAESRRQKAAERHSPVNLESVCVNGIGAERDCLPPSAFCLLLVDLLPAVRADEALAPPLLL
jgi:hypothetical protein